MANLRNCRRVAPSPPQAFHLPSVTFTETRTPKRNEDATGEKTGRGSGMSMLHGLHAGEGFGRWILHIFSNAAAAVDSRRESSFGNY